MHWTINKLTFGRRVTLANSTLEAIPIYLIMTSIIPKGCIDEIKNNNNACVQVLNKACILKLGRKILTGSNEV